MSAALVNGAREWVSEAEAVWQLSYPSEPLAARTIDTAPLQVVHRRELYDTRHLTVWLVLLEADAWTHQAPFETNCL
ncbi:MAG: hypothetical protein EA416_05980 [Trueperaceae bacterium]|nr:MAG: hypothetical protein EA416_05980 [Trueperaceae bacterium]